MFKGSMPALVTPFKNGAVDVDTLKKLVHKYSQFINFNIYLWQSKTEMVDEEVEEEPKEKEDGAVEEEKEEKKVKKVGF